MKCLRWLADFRSGNFNVQDTPHTGRPTTTDDDKMKVLMETNRCMTTARMLQRIEGNSSQHTH